MPCDCIQTCKIGSWWKLFLYFCLNFFHSIYFSRFLSFGLLLFLEILSFLFSVLCFFFYGIFIRMKKKNGIHSQSIMYFDWFKSDWANSMCVETFSPKIKQSHHFPPFLNRVIQFKWHSIDINQADALKYPVCEYRRIIFSCLMKKRNCAYRMQSCLFNLNQSKWNLFASDPLFLFWFVACSHKGRVFFFCSFARA